MSWAEKKSSAEALFLHNDYERAMEDYAAAAEAAANQNAAPRDIAKCYTNASQMAWKAFIIHLSSVECPEEDINRLGWKNRSYAQIAVEVDTSWVKGSVYLLRSLAFQFKSTKEAHILQEAKKLANLIMMHHYSDLPLSRIKNNALWLGLYLIKDPRYAEFIAQCPGFEVVKFPEEVLYISPTGSACFNSFLNAYNFVTALVCFGNVENFKFSLLLSPGKYLINVERFSTHQTDIVGNRSHKCLDKLKDDGIKILEESCAASDSVVLEFKNSSIGYIAPPKGLTLSRLSFVEKSKLNYTMFFCKTSIVHFNNCFFGSAFKSDITKSEFLDSINSSVFMKDCFMTQAACAALLTDSKAVFRSSYIEAYFIGIKTCSSQVNIENVHFNCHLTILCMDDSEVKVKKCVLHEEPQHFIEHARAITTPLVQVEKSTLSIEESMIGSEFCESYSWNNFLVANSKFIVKKCQIIQRDTQHAMEIVKGSNAIIEHNVFQFKNQQRKDIAPIVIGKTDVLEVHGNVIKDLDAILEKGYQISDFCMPADGITPKFSGNPKIGIISDLERVMIKRSDNFTLASVHYDRLGREGFKKSKAGNRLCHSCLKVEPEGEKSFRYCGNCKIVSYCSKECQKKNWKKEHRNWCNLNASQVVIGRI